MPRARIVPLLIAGSIFGGLIALAVLRGSAPAGALPPAGTDTLGVEATVHIAARGGAEIFPLNGTVTIVREAPHLESGVEVSNAEITSMQLDGFSLIGSIRASESATMTSSGEIRSQQAGQEYPASASFDAYLTIASPASPLGVLNLHNNIVLHFVSIDDITAWPPAGVRFQMDTPYNVDDDHDGQIDEDSSDDDGDGKYDEDRPGPDPDSPGGGFECGNDADCDHVEGEDPPTDLCPPATPGVHTKCDNDSDGLIDEDPSCIPLFNDNGTSLKAGACLREASFTMEDASSVTPIPSPTVNPTPTRTPRPHTSTPAPTSTATPTATPMLVGDANCDGTVNAIDSALILQKVAGLLPSLACAAAADANADGHVNAIDSALILQLSAGLIGHLPP
jgi:hypothetical protein